MPLEHRYCEFDPAVLYDTCACFSVLCCSVQVVPYCSDFSRTEREQHAAHPGRMLYTLYVSFSTYDVELLYCRSWLSHELRTTILPIIICSKLFAVYVRVREWSELKARFFFGATPPPPVGQGVPIHEVSRSHTKRLTTVGRAPLDE
jgi:hypothetical protein